ncbi:MAG: DUF4012 domain-containing protein [Acidimicrobiales bacterium]
MGLLVGGAVLVALAALATARPDLAGRTPPQAVPVAAALAGVAFALGGAAPTGWQPLDLLLRVGVAVGVVLSIARAGVGWTAYLAAGAAFVLLVGDAGGWEVVGGIGVALATVVVVVTGRQPGLQALAAAGCLAPFAHLDWPLVTGASGLVAGVVFVPILLKGLSGAPRSVRRATAWSAAAVIALSVVGAVVGGVSAFSARSDVDRAVDAATDGLDQLSDEDTDPAIAKLEESAASFESAESTLRAWWARPALLVPGVAQQSRAVATMADAGAELSRTAVASLKEADLDTLQPVDGQVDLDRVAAVSEPVHEAADVLVRSDHRLAEVDSPLLVQPVAERLADLSDRVAEARDAAETAAGAVDLAPDLLGADEPKTYFLMLQTPTELRGVGGFMGSWGELVVDDGHFELTRTGRLRELTEGGTDPAGRRIEGEPEFISRYGQAPAQYWGQIGFSPDFPTVARIVEQLYPESGGKEIDGVIALDPSSFARFVELTGPIDVPGYPQQITPENAEQVLLHDQYLALPDADREAFLEEATRVLFDKLTSGDLPAPGAIAAELSPAVTGKHLLLHAPARGEQRFFERIGADGAATADTMDAIGVVGQNFNGNKIDYFLRRNLTYDVEWDPGTGDVTGAVAVQLQNQAPSSGLPPAIIAWGGDVSFGQTPVKDGENLTFTSLYSKLSMDGLTLDGKPVDPLRKGVERGYEVQELYVLLPSGATRVLTADVEGQVEPGDRYTFEILRQPTAVADQYTVRVRLADGWELADGGREIVRTGDSSKPLRLDLEADRSHPNPLQWLRGE